MLYWSEEKRERRRFHSKLQTLTDDELILIGHRRSSHENISKGVIYFLLLLIHTFHIIFACISTKVILVSTTA